MISLIDSSTSMGPWGVMINEYPSGDGMMELAVSRLTRHCRNPSTTSDLGSFGSFLYLVLADTETNFIAFPRIEFGC